MRQRSDLEYFFREAMRPLDKQGDCLYDGGKMIEVKRNPNSRSVNGSFSFYWYYFFGAGFPVLT